MGLLPFLPIGSQSVSNDLPQVTPDWRYWGGIQAVCRLEFRDLLLVMNLMNSALFGFLPNLDTNFLNFLLMNLLHSVEFLWDFVDTEEGENLQER